MVDRKFRDGDPITVLEDLKDPWSEGDGPGDNFDQNLSIDKERGVFPLESHKTHDSCLHRFQLMLDSEYGFWPDIPACNPVRVAAFGGELTGPRVDLLHRMLDGFTSHIQDATPDGAPAVASLLRDQRFSGYMV